MWTKELVELLIAKYQENENLYNVRHPLYLNGVKRSATLFEITTELKKINKDITIEEIKKKYTLQDHSIRTLHDINTSKRSGAGLEDIVQPKLWCFEQLGFLKQYCTVRKSVSNISGLSEVDELNASSSEYVSKDNSNQNYESEAEPPRDKRKKTLTLTKTMDSIRMQLAKKLTEENKYDWLAKQVIFELNSLKDEELQRETAWKIQTVLREAAIKDAANRSTYSPLPSTSSSLPEISLGIGSSQNTSSYSSSPDILAQSLEGILDEDDF